MPVSRDYQAFILEQLAPILPVRPKPMFGEIGLYADATFFAIIADDTFYLKVDDQTRPDYEAAQMWPFAPMADKRPMPYYAVPAEVLEDSDELRVWVHKAVAAAERGKKRKTS